jgi:TolB protein
MRRSIILSSFVALAAGVVLAAAAAAGPPLNGKIAFSSYAAGESDIWVMNPHGGNKVNLTPEFGGSDFFPDWSPDGTKIAFSRFQLSGCCAFVSDIVVVNADGTGAATLTDGTSENTTPAWSPDGAKIAFSSTRDVDSNAEIYVMNADGTGVNALTETAFPTRNSGPAWSPDGTKIAFVRDPGGVGSFTDIYVMNADGSGVTQLTTATTGLIGNITPTWSPDGTRIAFDSDRDDGNREIYVMNADGTGQTNLTNSPAADTTPDWSPDGRLILFSSDRDGLATFYTLEVTEPSTVKTVTKGPIGEDPDWQRSVR